MNGHARQGTGGKEEGTRRRFFSCGVTRERKRAAAPKGGKRKKKEGTSRSSFPLPSISPKLGRSGGAGGERGKKRKKASGDSPCFFIMGEVVRLDGTRERGRSAERGRPQGPEGEIEKRKGKRKMHTLITVTYRDSYLLGSRFDLNHRRKEEQRCRRGEEEKVSGNIIA